MFTIVHSHSVVYIPIRMFLFFLLIISLYSASQSAGISRSETINVGNNSALDLATNCTAGFTLLNGFCVDVDECQSKNICPDGAVCVNIFGSYLCITCPLGERVRPGGSTCICDHEECSKMYGRSCRSVGSDLEWCLCAPELQWDSNREECYPRCPLSSSFNFTSSPKEDCACPDTHKKFGSFCLRECYNQGDCYGGGDCVLHEYYNICACPKGFKLDHAKKQCIDVDECRSRRRRCRPDDVSANVPGGYVCLNFKCDQGFTPQTELGLCLKEGIGITHFIRKAAIGLIMRDIRENQAFSTTKLPEAYKFELRELKIVPQEFTEYIQISIQSKDDNSQELIMKSIKPFSLPIAGNYHRVTIEVIAEASKDAFTYELRTELYVYRLPFTVDIIGDD